MQIQINRRFDASPEELWDCWTNPARIRGWFGSDPNGEVLTARLDLRLGGSFEVTFRDADGTEHTCGGRYLDLQPHAKLAFSWRWKNEPGAESSIVVELKPVGTWTEMLFEHANPIGNSSHDYAAPAGGEHSTNFNACSNVTLPRNLKNVCLRRT